MHLPRTRAVIERGLSDGLHVGAQFCVFLRHELILDWAIGLARPAVPEIGQAPLPMTPDTLTLWLSAGKPVTAVAIAQLWERGLLHLDEPVAAHVPGFEQNGKGDITVRHVLTHMAPLRLVDTGWPDTPWDEIIARIAAARPEPRFVPGRTAGYSAHVTWFLLGEVVQRLSGRPLGAYLRDHLLAPAGMADTHLALTPEQQAGLAERLAVMQITEKRPAPPFPQGYDTPEALAAPRPSASLRGPVRDLARFYEALAHSRERVGSRQSAVGSADGPAGNRQSATGNHSGLSTQHSGLLLPQTVEAMTARHRTHVHDKSFNAIVDWGLGFVLNTNIYGNPYTPYQYGPHASPRTFGHSGNQSSAAFHDPEHGLTVALLFNGLAGESAHQSRTREVLGTLYEELGLAS